MFNPTASTADAGPAFAAAMEASVGRRAVMPASVSAVYPATSAWEPGPRPAVVGSRSRRVSRPSVASSIHGSFTTRYLELSCASSVVAPLPAAAAWAADPDLKVSRRPRRSWKLTQVVARTTTTIIVTGSRHLVNVTEWSQSHCLSFLKFR